MSEHNLKLDEATRNRIRNKYQYLKTLKLSAGVLFWNSAKRGTYKIGRNSAKRAKKNDRSRTH